MIKYTEEVDQIYDQVGYTGLHQASKYIFIRLLWDRSIKYIDHTCCSKLHQAPQCMLNKWSYQNDRPYWSSEKFGIITTSFVDLNPTVWFASCLNPPVEDLIEGLISISPTLPWLLHAAKKYKKS